MTESLSQRQRGSLVQALSSSLEHGGTALGTVPMALRRLLSEKAWEEFTTSRGERVTYDRFADFVTTPPLKGLGSSQKQLYRIAPELVDELDEAFGRKTRSDKITDNVDNIHDIVELERPAGTSRRAAIRRLRKDAPELHSEVIAGNISAHAAMVQAGFRRRTFTVPADNPESIARTLKKNMRPEDVAELIRLLSGAEDDDESR